MSFRAVALLTLALACESNQAPAPIDPVWGKVPCKHCSMLVSERHPASQAVLADGVRAYFDDVGCMALFLDAEKAPHRAAWANDGQGGWVAVAAARFKSGQRTPMDFGFLASSDGSASFDEVRTSVRAKARRSSP